MHEIALAIVSAFCCENPAVRRGRWDDRWVEESLKELVREFPLNQECVKWVLDVGVSAPSHPLLQLLDSPEGEKTKEIIQNKVSCSGNE